MSEQALSQGGGATTRARLRRRVFELLDEGSQDRQSRIVDIILISLVGVSVAAAVLESVPAYEAAFSPAFRVVEVVSLAGFTLEYALRLWCAPEDAIMRLKRPWRARLAWAIQPQSLVDLVAIAPVYLALFSELDLRSFLILRLLRFFKLARYSPGLASLFGAIYSERRALSACGVILIGTVLITASVMHYAEQEAQPDKLGTIPDAMYWAFVTLATVGYGDVVPVTPLGKIIAAVTAVVGIIMLALPVGILASAFADEIRKRDFVVTWTMVARVPIFAGLGAADLAKITRVLNARSCERGEAIVRKGEPAHSMYFITSGSVVVELPENPIRLGEGDFFGEMALIHNTERSATVTATSRVRLLVLDRTDFKYLTDQAPDMGQRIREIADRRRQEPSPTGGDGVEDEVREEAGEERPRSS